MRLAVLKERRASETRVAATPETVKRLIGLGLTVAIEAGAGVAGRHSRRRVRRRRRRDRAGCRRGARRCRDRVRRADAAARAACADPARRACWSASPTPSPNPTWCPISRQAGIDCAAMELLPRITRAQAMDVLSSQANQAGYRAVIEAAGAFQRGFPMMMTAAGTVPPARLFVIGAGVAGLQAIATARRLGAIVSATDVRPAAKEEIKSLGASLRRRGGRGDRQPDRRLCPRDERGIPPEAGRADGDHDRQERSGRSAPPWSWVAGRRSS